MVEAGVDIVEVGLPYSDPLIDGPTIQAAVDSSLSAGIRTKDVLATVRAVSAFGAPALVMSYWNPIEHYGVEAFAADLATAGGAGAITPDLHDRGGWGLAHGCPVPRARHCLPRGPVLAAGTHRPRLPVVPRIRLCGVHDGGDGGPVGAR